MKFLLIVFLFFPNGNIETAKRPFATLEQCRAEGSKISQRGDSQGVGVIGSCITPKDYETDA